MPICPKKFSRGHRFFSVVLCVKLGCSSSKTTAVSAVLPRGQPIKAGLTSPPLASFFSLVTNLETDLLPLFFLGNRGRCVRVRKKSASSQGCRAPVLHKSCIAVGSSSDRNVVLDRDTSFLFPSSWEFIPQFPAPIFF